MVLKTLLSCNSYTTMTKSMKFVSGIGCEGEIADIGWYREATYSLS
jgi:hypothetical protein